MQVACGGMNSVVLTEGGEVWTWGEPWGEFALELQRAPRKVNNSALHYMHVTLHYMLNQEFKKS
jgi:alpha-tubulin suppressor-like RCC1 family protein